MKKPNNRKNWSMKSIILLLIVSSLLLSCGDDNNSKRNLSNTTNEVVNEHKQKQTMLNVEAIALKETSSRIYRPIEKFANNKGGNEMEITSLINSQSIACGKIMKMANQNPSLISPESRLAILLGSNAIYIDGTECFDYEKTLNEYNR